MTGVNASINAYGTAVNSGNIENSMLSFYGDFVNNGTINGGEVIINSDIYNGGKINLDKLTLEANTLITVDGNAVDTVDLFLKGKSEVRLNTTINVSKKYENNGVRVNDDNVIIVDGKTMIDDREYKTLNITTDLVLDGCTITANDLITSANIELKNGARLVVRNSFTSKGDGVLNIESGSEFKIAGTANVSGLSKLTVDGLMSVNGDASISAAVIGDGTAVFGGDLYGGAKIDGLRELVFSAKVPQKINCTGSAVNLTVSNSSLDGVRFENEMSYTGSFTKSGNVAGSVTKR